MKLIGQTGQYWENHEMMMQFTRDGPVETWEGIKEKLWLIYLPTVNRYWTNGIGQME